MSASNDLTDLLALGAAMDDWGNAVKDQLPLLPKLALAFNMIASRTFGRHDAQYGALDESAYQIIKKNGLDTDNQARDRAALEKALRMRDTHVRIIARTTSRRTLAAAFSAKPDNLAEMIATAEQHQLRAISTLLRKSFG